MLRDAGGARGARYLVRVLGLAAAYWGAAELGIRLAAGNQLVTAVWPPTGIAVVALLLGGRRLWPGIALGAFVAEATAGVALPFAAGMAVGNTLAPVLAALAIDRLRIHRRLEHVRDVLLFVAVAASAMLVSATNGTVFFELSHTTTRPVMVTWLIWWVGDAMGVLLIAPAGLALGNGGLRSLGRRKEAVLSVVGTGLLAFVLWYQPLPLRHLLIPVAMVGALRLGPVGAATITLVVAGVGIGTAAWTPRADDYLLLQTVNASMAITSLVLAAVMHERNQKAVALQAVAADLESRVRDRTAALAEANAELAQAQRLANLGSFTLDARTGEARWSDELYRIHERDPALGPLSIEEYLDLIDPADREPSTAALEAAMSVGEPLDHDFCIVLPGGRRKWIHSYVVPIRDEDGTYIGLTGASQDVTDRRRAEEGHRLAEEKLRALVDSAPDAFVVSDHDGRIVLLNERASQLFRCLRHGIVGSSVEALLTTDDEGQQWVRCRDGSMVPVDVRHSPVQTRDGVLQVTSLRDASARRRVEEALRTALDREREATAHLRKLDETKNAILNSVSHELRTPLTAILGFSELLQSPEIRADAATSEDVLQRLDGSARRLARLLQDLLDLSRLEHVNIQPKRVTCRISDLMETSLLDLDLEEHPLYVDHVDGTCTVDPTYFERIVQNLVGNAVKYTPKATPIHVWAEPEPGGGVTIAVEDEGPGIPADKRTTIFEPFARLGSSAFTQGAGIGLALVDRFAKMHGGRAWLTERPGGGAAFRVCLPGVELSGRNPEAAA